MKTTSVTQSQRVSDVPRYTLFQLIFSVLTWIISYYLVDDYVEQYKQLRINEINIDTLGFADVGEYVELTGKFIVPYLTG